ncbi:MAG: CHC2 zinc finger domain-containing protein, partial [Rhodanobacter sp.]
MRGLIPDSFIDELLARVDIVDVIERRVPLKKAGREWTACCPFHNERSPSFTVSQAKQFFHCFGCGVH